MREFFGGLLALVSMAAFITSLIAIFRPFPKIGLPTRGRAVLALVGSFLLMAVAGAILPPQDGDATAEAKPANTSKAEPKTEAAPDMTAEVQATFAQLTDKVEACDAASKVVASTFERTKDPYAIYPVVTRATDACKESWLSMNDLKPPPSARGAVKTAFKEAIETCSTAYFMKYQAYEAMAKVLDGDTRPSAVTKAREGMESATTGQVVCVAGFFSAAERAGVGMDKVAGEKAKAS